MVRGLASAFEQLEGDRGRAVLLTGQGQAMCAGTDEDIVSDDYATEHSGLHGTLEGMYRQVETHPGPVALAGHGAVIGAAMLVSLSCEFVVVVAETTLAIPKVSSTSPPTGRRRSSRATSAARSPASWCSRASHSTPGGPGR
jgi:enoyl-CoA hydratase/carnithine racemase